MKKVTPEQRQAKKQEWIANNKERIAKSVKAYTEKHKEHLSALKAAQYKEKRNWVTDYKMKHPCEICGEKDPIVLEFHHVNPKEKDASIADLLSRKTLDAIKLEVVKCIVLCGNCHTRLHYYERYPI